MEDFLSKKEMCRVCNHHMTSIHAEIAPGQLVYVCEKCLDSAKENFIWICLHCGSVYIRPKSLVLKRLIDPGLKRAYQECAHLQLIQGIDRCIECDAPGIVARVEEEKGVKHGGHC